MTSKIIYLPFKNKNNSSNSIDLAKIIHFAKKNHPWPLYPKKQTETSYKNKNLGINNTVEVERGYNGKEKTEKQFRNGDKLGEESASNSVHEITKENNYVFFDGRRRPRAALQKI